MLKFLSQHTGIVGLILGITLLLIIIESLYWFVGTQSVSPIRATLLMNREGANVLDLRKEADFHEAHLPNAIRVKSLSLEIMTQLSPHQPILFITASSNPPLLWLRQWRTAGFSKLYHLEGGMSAWQHAQLPLTRFSST